MFEVGRNLSGSQRHYGHWATFNCYQATAMCGMVDLSWERNYFMGQNNGQNLWDSAELVTDIQKDTVGLE